MRKILRLMVCAAVAAAMTVALAGPAHAASTVRALWDMGNPSVMVDSAGGDNNGSTRNITSAGSGLYNFNGKSSIATVPDKANLDPGTATIRLTARVRITTVPRAGQTYDIVRKGVTTSAGGDYKMEILRSSSGAAVAGCTFKDAKKVSGRAYGTVNLAGTGFQTITCIKTPTSMQVIAGGQTRTSKKAIGSISNTAPVYVGGKGDGTDFFPGVMDFVKIEIG